MQCGEGTAELGDSAYHAKSKLWGGARLEFVDISILAPRSTRKYKPDAYRSSGDLESYLNRSNLSVALRLN